MTRAHRRWHFWIWVFLGPIVLLGFLIGLSARSTSEVENMPVVHSVANEVTP